MNDPNPNPEVWPRCSECEVDYTLRRCMVFGATSGWKWLWQRDCKHKKAAPVVVHAEGDAS